MAEGANNETGPENRIRKRLVFYFSGFDPRGPSHYHKLYAEESAKQSRLNGLDLEIGKRRKVHQFSHAWEILEKNSGTRTTYECLRWDDVIRGYWPKNEMELIRATIPTYRAFFAANLIGKLRKFSRPFAMAVTYPFMGFIGVLLFSALLLLVLLALSFSSILPMWVGMIGVVAIPIGTLAFVRLLDSKLRTYWLLRAYAVMQKWSYGEIPELDTRLHDLSTYLLERMGTSDADEVLLAGHSAGTILTVPIAAELVRRKPDLGESGADFALLTLGGCIPLVSMLPGAKGIREDLKTVAEAKGVRWVDFSGRGDGASISGADPLLVSGITRKPGQPVRPIHKPMRIHKMFSKEDYAELKKDVFRLHFQYVMAGDLLSDYDYFEITAGQMSIATRYPESPLS